MLFNSNSSILITGGTGSFGRAFIEDTFRRYPDLKRLVVYSRDELKQWQLQQLYPPDRYPQLRLFLGDVRDRGRLMSALEDVNIVIHAAALKQVPRCSHAHTRLCTRASAHASRSSVVSAASEGVSPAGVAAASVSLQMRWSAASS